MNLGARRSRVLGVIWILAGLGLLGGAVVLWLDRRVVSVWEVPLAVVAVVIGLYLWSQRVTVDRYGITLSSMMGSQRILWAGIAAVDMQATWWRPSMTIHRKGDGQTTPIRTTSGLTAKQRDVLFDLLLELSRDHGFEVSRPGMPDVAAALPVSRPSAAAGSSRVSPGAGANDSATEEVPANDVEIPPDDVDLDAAAAEAGEDHVDPTLDDPIAEDGESEADPALDESVADAGEHEVDPVLDNVSTDVEDEVVDAESEETDEVDAAAPAASSTESAGDAGAPTDESAADGDLAEDLADDVVVDQDVIDGQDTPSDPDATVAMDPVSVDRSPDQDVTEEVVVDETTVTGDGASPDLDTAQAASVVVGEPRDDQ